MRDGGFAVLNEVAINQVLVRAGSDAATNTIREHVTATGAAWFGPTVWQGRPAFRLSVSSWRTEDADIEALADALIAAREAIEKRGGARRSRGVPRTSRGVRARVVGGGGCCCCEAFVAVHGFGPHGCWCALV